MYTHKHELAVWFVCVCVFVRRLFFCTFRNECSENLSISQLGRAYDDLVRAVKRHNSLY